MLKKTVLLIILPVITCSYLSGCQQQTNYTYSGFLGDYSRLKPSPVVEGALYYQDPSKDLSDYDKFILEPVRVYLAHDAEDDSIDPAKLKELADYVGEELTKAFNRRYQYQVVQNPGPRVLLLRGAITGVDKTKPLLNVHPATKLSGIGLGGASMEAEAIDSMTGKRVFAVVDSRRGNVLSIGAGLEEFGHAKQVIDHWVKRFERRLDEAHGYSSE